MSKEIKNIDDLFKSTLESHAVKAPGTIRKQVFSKTSLWTKSIIITLIATPIIAVTIWQLTTSNKNENTLYSIRTTTNNFQLKQIDEKVETEVIQFEKLNLNDQLRAEKGNNNTEKINNTKSIIKENKSIVQIKEIETKINSTLDTIIKPTSKETFIENDFIQTAIKNDSIDVHFEKDMTKLLISNQEVDSRKEFAQQNDIKPNKEIELIPETYQKQIDSSNSISFNSELPNAPNESEIIIKNNNDTTIQNNEVEAITDLPEKENNLESETTTKEDFEIDNITSQRNGSWMVNGFIGRKINKVNYTGLVEDYLLENQLENIGAYGQITVDYTLNNGINFNSGLGLESQSYQTSYWTTSTNIVDIDSNIILSHINSEEFYDTSTQQYITVFDSVYRTVFDTTSESVVNSSFGKTKINYIQVPIHIGYRFKTNQWLIGLSAGLQINYKYANKGTYYLNNEVFNLEKENNVFNQFAFQYQLGADFNYSLTDKLYLKSQLIYTLKSSNYYNANYNSRTNTSLHVGAGIGYKF